MKEFTKDESKMLKGIAILFMVGLHLYNRVELEGLYTPLIMIGDYPLVYYISFLFDACVPIYCFCSGYAAYLMKEKNKKSKYGRLLKLMIQYWIVLILTCILGIAFQHEYIPGSIVTFINNTFLFRISYVGAWWFMQTYVLLMLCSNWLIKIVDRNRWYIIAFSSIVIYFIAYYFRMIHVISFNNALLDSIFNAMVLFGTSVFPFIVGILFRKYKVISFVRKRFNQFSGIIGVFIIIACCIGHIIVKSMIVAPFIGILFIVGYSLLNIHGIMKRVLLFFGNHSTNIWLTHMQFYSIFFSSVVFCTDTVVGCFVILMLMCIAGSYLIHIISKSVNYFFKY